MLGEWELELKVIQVVGEEDDSCQSPRIIYVRRRGHGDAIFVTFVTHGHVDQCVQSANVDLDRKHKGP